MLSHQDAQFKPAPNSRASDARIPEYEVIGPANRGPAREDAGRAQCRLPCPVGGAVACAFAGVLGVLVVVGLGVDVLLGDALGVWAGRT